LVVLTLRDMGVYLSILIPFLRAPAKWIYLRLPRCLHDTPTSWLEAYLSKDSDITFIQAGAFDGIAGDPLRTLILAHPNWQGALVEPMATAFVQLKTNYAQVTQRLKFFNCAISDRVGTTEMYEINESEIERLRLPHWSREIASVSESHIKMHFPNAHVSKHTVPVTRISNVVKACGYKRVDLVVIDVEGHERQIIDDIDFISLGVRVLLFEHKHMTITDEEAVLNRLKSFDFMTRKYGRDTVAYRSLGMQ
jgi:FkbM family methyltransferase